jgi:hypothetical protein
MYVLTRLFTQDGARSFPPTCSSYFSLYCQNDLSLFTDSQYSIPGLTHFAMYPDWPESPSDLVPLPLCEGPKLEPFDFQGPQKIDFLQHIGEGSHSHVFKVEILGQIYALKLASNLRDTTSMYQLTPM